MSDENGAAAIVDEVLQDPSSTASIADIKAGKDKAIGYLVGQVMKKSQGKANGWRKANSGQNIGVVMQRPTKAIIAAAGFGTRFLPQTKAMPKEMMPIIDKPIIQYVVEELVEAGIKDIIIVGSSRSVQLKITSTCQMRTCSPTFGLAERKRNHSLPW